MSNQDKAQRLNFSKKRIEALPLPETSKRSTIHDTKESGLVLITTSKGTRSFYLYRKVDGRPERIFLGRFPDTTVENARKLASRLKGEIAQGKNPQAERRKMRAEITFGEMFHEFMERYSKKEKRSWQYDEREVNRFLAHWFSRKSSSITPQEIQKQHEHIRDENGLYQANRILERIRAIYNKAIEWGWEGVNPTTGIKKFKETSRDRFIQPEELPHFFRAMREEANTTARDYILLSLLTGARKSNVLSMRWEEISFARDVWRIPETKNGEPLDVPLSPEAVEILEARKHASENEWVFPGTGRHGYLQDPKKAWRRILYRATLSLWTEDENLTPLVEEGKLCIRGEYSCRRHYEAVLAIAQERQTHLPSGLTDLRLHDLRRTLGSWQAASGATTTIIGKSLGHKSQTATKVYERLNLDPVKQSVNAATAAMFAAGEYTENT